MKSANLVSTLGTLHDIFLSNANYSHRDFASALYQFKPDIILSEVRPEFPSKEDAAIDGGIEQALVFAYATEQSIPVVPTDWFDDAFLQESEQENNKINSELMTTLQALSEFRKSLLTESLLTLSSEDFQNHMRHIYGVYEKNGLLASRKRNDRILQNIKKELSQIHGKKVLIIYGMDHKFFIDDHLRDMDNVIVQNISDWFNLETSKSFQISDFLKNESLQNLESSNSLLKARLQSNHYPATMSIKLQSKLSRFENWIAAISRL